MIRTEGQICHTRTRRLDFVCHFLIKEVPAPQYRFVLSDKSVTTTVKQYTHRQYQPPYEKSATTNVIYRYMLVSFMLLSLLFLSSIPNINRALLNNVSSIQ